MKTKNDIFAGRNDKNIFQFWDNVDYLLYALGIVKETTLDKVLDDLRKRLDYK